MTLILAATLIAGCTKESKKARLLAEADDYFKSGNYDKAKLTYLNALRLDPQNALALERIGTMWLEDGAPLRAAAFLAKASELAPKNNQTRIHLARCYLAIGRFNDANKEALKKNSGKITSAAADLGISRPTLYELMEKLGISKERAATNINH